MIDTRLVYGFLESGKTTYIQDCIFHDYFHKYGSVLILCFEQGEEEYDTEALRRFRTNVVCYEGGEDITQFCRRMIEEYQPDRIYVEMNLMTQDLRAKLPDCMNVTFACAFIDYSTLDLYFRNFRQLISNMVRDCHQVTFRDCPSKELLAPYSQAFRLMNRGASYLRRDPMGYHEKAFDLFVPYSLEEETIRISEQEHLVFWLDGSDHPEHYAGKKLVFTTPLELRRLPGEEYCTAGRIVMTCCMADLQFMGFRLTQEAAGISEDVPEGGAGKWIRLEAEGVNERDPYGRLMLRLQPREVRKAAPPDELILSARVN